MSSRMAFSPDGSGMAYYLSGRVAACVSEVNDYSSRFYFYDDDRKGTLLCAVDEHAVGFAIGDDGARLVLNKTKGMLSDGDGTITHEWKWARGAQRAGKPPPRVELRLNDSMTFVFTGRTEMEVKLRFADGDASRGGGRRGGGGDAGLARDFDVGHKTKRTDTYLDHATRGLAGALDPQIDRISLSDRVTAVGEAAAADRNRLHPKSSALANAGARAVVAGLERDFDTYDADHTAPREFPTGWRSDALARTKDEVPRLAPTGDETGPTPGLGSTIYTGKLKGPEDDEPKKPPADAGPPPHWSLNALEMRQALMEQNPLLERSSILCDASGRYAEDIVVPGGVVTATNPTGKRESGRETLQVVDPRDLATFVDERCSPTQLVCVACVRQDDRVCRKAEAVAESVWGAILRGDTGLPGDDGANTSEADLKYRVAKVEMSANRDVAERYGVRALPTFLMFYGGQLVYRGQLGGEAIRVAREFKPYSVLYVEPNFKDQIWSEKMLKKQRFSWELCMNASEATQRKQQLDRRAIDGGAAGSQRGYDVVLVSSACPPEECGALERLFKRAAGPAGSGKDVLVCGLAALSGDAGADALTVASWVGKRRGVTMDVDVLLPPALAAIADVAITKPLKANALEDLVDFLESRAAAASRAEAGLPPADGVHKGLTKAALVKQLWESLKAGQRGAFLPDLKALRGGKKPKKIPLAPPIKRKVVFPPPPHDVTIESLIESKME